ncbi:MAG TPA: hypothetical protein VIG08_00900 [Gemmatimonadales bacterium]|jgi:hypothetical protein
MGLLRTVLEGHDETLDWRDFQGTAPANPAGDAAQTEARFDFQYDYEWDDSKGDHHGYRVNNVQVKVILDRASMWVVKGARSDALLKHEQGHYDIVALIARDLFNELTGWETPKAPKRFKKQTDLKTAADRLGRQAKALAARLSGTASSVGVYDTQTKHGQDTQAQDKWDKALEAARSKGSRVMAGLSVLGVGP